MHAAHERIVYERLKRQMDGSANAVPRRLASQPLLIPATFAATPQEIATAEAQRRRRCRRWAWRSRRSRRRPLAVRAVPTTLAQGDAVELARSVLAELAQHDASTVVQRARERAARPPWPATARCAPTASSRSTR